MAKLDIPHRRLESHHLVQPAFKDPGDVVNWFGAVQAQDYLVALWSLGMRMTQASADDVEGAFNDGRILRTHLMRPTWHFVTPADIRWLLALTAPRVNALNAVYYRKTGLDAPTFSRSHKALEKAMRGGNSLTRAEITAALMQAGIEASGLRFVYLLMRAELEQVICSGPRRGKQFTYMLLDERAPEATAAAALDRDEALAELTHRYFRGHGPATPHDFVWWSGLTLADAKAGIAMAGSRLVREETFGGRTYWRGPARRGIKHTSPSALLLAPYDEYTLSYKDRSDILNPAYIEQTKDDLFWSMIVIDGQILGSWRRTFSQGKVVVETKRFVKFTAAQERAVAAAVRRFGEFLGMAVVLK